MLHIGEKEASKPNELTDIQGAKDQTQLFRKCLVWTSKIKDA